VKKYAMLGAIVVLLGAGLWFIYRNPWAPVPTSQQSTLAKELHLFIWEEYLDAQIKTDFEKEFGVKIIEDNYGSNEELLAKLQAGGSGYDVIVPTDYTVSLMRKQNLLAQLNLTNIPNLKHISENFKNLEFDPQNEVSVPYLWGTTGIGYNQQELSKAPTSWADLFDPAKLESHRGRISMLNDGRECIGAALIYLGYSPNTTDPSQLEEAKQILLKQKEFLAKYDSESFEDSLAGNETVIAHSWSGEITVAGGSNSNLRFVIPKEGSLIFLDNLAIPKSSTNQYTAEVFINYLLRPDVSAKIVNSRMYASPNEAAKALIKPEILNSPSYLLPEGIKLHWLEDLGSAGDIYQKIWTEVKGH
jgi:spermidine/putrescine transport system substrate-binding protein